MPSTPKDAKGLLLASIRSKDPVIFFEPKTLYRSAVEEVPEDDYEIELGKAKIVQEGTDVTLIGYGSQMNNINKAAKDAEAAGISVEVIDLMSLLPWDVETVVESVQKTGKLIISHEAPITGGFAAEIASKIQEHCFLSLEAPIRRVCGYDTPFPLVYEKMYIPDHLKLLEAIKETTSF